MVIPSNTRHKSFYCKFIKIYHINSVYIKIFFLSRYERLLRRAKTEDLTEVSGIGCLYQSGVDRLGRPVVVFVGKWFPFSKINLDKVRVIGLPFLYFDFFGTFNIVFFQLNCDRLYFREIIYFSKPFDNSL